jgi:HlyD family secretion protein
VQSNFSVQQATVKSANVALDRARQNLAYTSIYAPIDGVIVERNVDVGQTVAASLSAPQLFLIANDLSAMQILASVDESDIGLIKEGQPVQFTVQSYSNQTFSGTVQQVRLQSTTQDNVVNYTVVIAVKNETGKLLPGMTATVQFQTGSADNVLAVPNAALRIKPTADMLAAAGLGTQAPTTRDSTARPAPSGSNATNGASAGRSGPPRTNGARSGSGGTLWTIDSTGKVKPMRVRVGLTDGQKTEVQGATLAEGTQVIVSVGGATATSTTTTAPTANPFQPQRPSGGGRGF